MATNDTAASSFDLEPEDDLDAMLSSATSHSEDDAGHSRNDLDLEKAASDAYSTPSEPYRAAEPTYVAPPPSPEQPTAYAPSVSTVEDDLARMEAVLGGETTPSPEEVAEDAYTNTTESAKVEGDEYSAPTFSDLSEDDTFVDDAPPPVLTPVQEEPTQTGDTYGRPPRTPFSQQTHPQGGRLAPPPAPPVTASPLDSPRVKVRVPTTAEMLDNTARVIRIVDAYRSLSIEEKGVAIQFVTAGNHDEGADHEIVVYILNADPMLAKTMKALREAYEEDQVERAFYIMDLDIKTLHGLGELVAVFTEDNYDTSLNNLQFARVLTTAIAKLGEREIAFVKATESVLSAAL